MTIAGRSFRKCVRSGVMAAFCGVMLASGAAQADADELSKPAAARQFRISGSFCFMPCMDGLKNGAKDHQHDIVTISRIELSGPMIARCDGLVAVTVREGTSEDVMEDLHRRYGGEALTSAAQIVLPAGRFEMGAATCTPKGGTPSTFARLLSIEPERVTLLTDSGIVYELVPEGR